MKKEFGEIKGEKGKNVENKKFLIIVNENLKRSILWKENGI